ncbi:hypothetical protein DSO57_1006868 [Entomophthora muscae]|uniref:Uncharacterized protein n=1 Tax=Entomophthora muscae TaxID=34485 RepID=A0ACC2SKN1_9FUNG|nr:hypothetical protein DSO57_1006868 [Entomophthora muscae]
MKEIPTTSPLPNTPPAQELSKLGFVYITILGLADQAVPILEVTPIVCMAFQAQPASPVGVQPDSGMGVTQRKSHCELHELEVLMGLRPNPMTTTLEKDNQVANSRSLTNERTPSPAPRSPSSIFPDALMDLPWKLLSLEVGTISSGPPSPPSTNSCPPGFPFGPIHFTEYPLKPKYKDYTPEKILNLDPLACIQSAVRYNQANSTTCLQTPHPMPASSPDLPTDHTGKLFGIVYIILTGVIDTIIPAAGPWSWEGMSFSYLFKLAALL